MSGAIQRVQTRIRDNMEVLNTASVVNRKEDHDSALCAQAGDLGNQCIPVYANSIYNLIEIRTEVISPHIGKDDSVSLRRKVRAVNGRADPGATRQRTSSGLITGLIQNLVPPGQ